MSTAAQSPTVWCPGCGAEYLAGATRCSECGVALLPNRPGGLGRRSEDRRSEDRRSEDTASRADGSGSGDDDGIELVEIGSWPRLSAVILRRRLETADISVMVEWHGSGADAAGTLLVPEAQADFARAVVVEIDVDDEVPDTSPLAYVVRVEEHLAAAAGLLEELRVRLDDLEVTDRKRS